MASGLFALPSILASWAEQKAVREIMIFLHTHGVGTARAVRIFKTYGADAIQVMTENPYRLARDIRGIGFKTADADRDETRHRQDGDDPRARRNFHALTEAMDEGHCGLPTEELIPLPRSCSRSRSSSSALRSISSYRRARSSPTELAKRRVYFWLVCIGRSAPSRNGCVRLANGALPWPWIDPDKALPWVEKHIGLTLAESQVAAIRLALKSKVLVITGGPGVGKTTIVKAILRILAAKGINILLCAPTGRAAKRMTEATGFEAKTIHRLLEVDPKSGTSSAAMITRSIVTFWLSTRPPWSMSC